MSTQDPLGFSEEAVSSVIRFRNKVLIGIALLAIVAITWSVV